MAAYWKERGLIRPFSQSVIVRFPPNAELLGHVFLTQVQFPPTLLQVFAQGGRIRVRTHKWDSQAERFVIQGLRRETADGSRLFLAERRTIRAA